MRRREQATDSVWRSTSKVEEAIRELAWPPQRRPDRFGMEVEAFPVLVGDRGPATRPWLTGSRPSVVAIVERQASPRPAIRPRSPGTTWFPTAAGGRISFEPGAQIEQWLGCGSTTG